MGQRLCVFNVSASRRCAPFPLNQVREPPIKRVIASIDANPKIHFRAPKGIDRAYTYIYIYIPPTFGDKS